MCGLVGAMSYPLLKQEREVFNTLLYLDVLRGEHSTGVAKICGVHGKNPRYELYKAVGTPTDLFNKYKLKGSAVLTQGELSWSQPDVLIGHNRFATQGLVNEANAHPFEIGNVIGCHNGTVSKHSIKDFHNPENFDVDSKILFSHLDHTGDINEIWKNADGAMALVWWDKEKKTLQMIRNKQRPLFVAYGEDDKSIFWASEEWMLYIATSRNAVKIKEPFKLSDSNKLYTFDVKEGGEIFHTESDVAPFQEKWRSSYTNYQMGYKSWWENESDTTKEEDNYSPKILEFIITEIHEPTHGPNLAYGQTLEGKHHVQITLPVADYEKVKKKIIGSKGQGHYVSQRAFFQRSVEGKKQYWAHWNSVNWVRKKSGADFAPWFDKNNALTYEAWRKQVGVGCACCGSVPIWSERNAIKWFSDTEYLCVTCKDDPAVIEEMNRFQVVEKGA